MADNNKNVRVLVVLLYALMFIFMFGVPFALIMSTIKPLDNNWFP